MLGGSYYGQSQHALNEDGDMVRSYLFAQKAAAAYPLDRQIRQWRAISGVGLEGIHPDLSIEDALRALEQDPHDANVMSVVFIQALRKGDMRMAEEYLLKMKTVAADWHQIEQFEQIYDQVVTAIEKH